MAKLSILIVAFVVVVGCSKDPVPPGPGPGPGPIVPGPNSFVVNGKAIKVEGVLKSGTKVTVSEAEKAVRTAVNILEKAE